MGDDTVTQGLVWWREFMLFVHWFTLPPLRVLSVGPGDGLPCL
jgi:hypothetical protein